jgi:hypothetical protein
MKNLFIVVHPDDESIGCGAVMHHLRNEENYVGLMCSSSFKSMRAGEVDGNDRIEKFKKSLEILIGHSNFELFSKETSLSLKDEYTITGFIDSLIKKYQPDRVFFPWKSNHHDHRRVYECCLASSRIGIHNQSVKQYYFYDYPFYQFSSQENGTTYLELDKYSVEAVVKSSELYQSVLDTNSLFSPNGVSHTLESRGYEIGKQYATKIVLFKEFRLCL